VRKVPDLGVTYDWLGVFSHECEKSSWLGRYIRLTWALHTMYVYACICTYMQVWACIRKYMYVFVRPSHLYNYTWHFFSGYGKHANMYKYVHIRANTYRIHINTYTYIQIHAHLTPKSCIQLYLAYFQWIWHTCKYVQIRAYTCKYNNIHLDTYTYIQTWIRTTKVCRDMPPLRLTLAGPPLGHGPGRPGASSRPHCWARQSGPDSSWAARASGQLELEGPGHWRQSAWARASHPAWQAALGLSHGDAVTSARPLILTW
jgi:hypothetical protein